MVDIIQIIQSAIINAISGIISNGIYIILVIWATKKIIKEIPHWLDQYHKIKLEQYAIERSIRR